MQLIVMFLRMYWKSFYLLYCGVWLGLQFLCYVSYKLCYFLAILHDDEQTSPWQRSVLIDIQSVSRLVDITAGGDFLGLCDQKSSYKHVSDFGRLGSYGHFLFPYTPSCEPRYGTSWRVMHSAWCLILCVASVICHLTSLPSYRQYSFRIRTLGS